jgi:hypothetical protein
MTVATTLEIVEDDGRKHFVRGLPLQVPANNFRETWILSGDRAVKKYVHERERVRHD